MFKDEKEFKNFVDKLNIDTKSNSAHREKFKKQMLSAFDENSQKQKSGHVTSLEYIRNKIMKSPITKIAAAILIVVLILTMNTSDKLYAKVTASLRKADTLHVSGEYSDKDVLFNFEIWYDKNIGLGRYDYNGDKTTIRLYDNSHMWQYSSGNKYAIQSNKIDTNYFINELLNITPNQDFVRDASGDKVIDGFQCKLYVSYNDTKTNQKSMWLDDMNRVRYTEYSYKKQDGNIFRSYSHFKYDIEIDSKVFSKDFGENVTIVDSEKILNEMFSIENAVYSEETLGMIFAVHRAELCSDGTIYVESSVRPDENSRQIVKQRDPRSYNFGRSILNIGNNIELAQAYHNGIEIKWYVIPDYNFPTSSDSDLQISAIVENNGELEKYRKAKELAVFKTIAQSVPLTKTNRSINEIIEDVYSQATLLEPEIAMMRLDISHEEVPDITGQSPTGIAYRQRFKTPSEISLKEYMDEIMTDIERIKQVIANANAISDIEESISKSESEPEEPLQVTTADTEPNELSTEIQEIKTGVYGVVIDKDTLEPIEGALIRNSDNIEVLTDNNGYFILPFTGIIKEEHISIKASGYALQVAMARIEEGRITEISIKLTRGIKISGIVLDPNNEPVSGAQVRTNGNVRPVTTGEDGRFEFEGINPVFTLPRTIRVNHPLYTQVLIKCPPDSTGKNIYREITLKPGVLVFGKVTDPNGEPVAGVTVGNTKATTLWNSIKCETDVEGMYVLDNVDFGELTLWVFDKNFAPYVLNTVLNPNQSKQQIDIQLSVPTEFKGIVLDKNNNPITNAYATIQGYNGVKGITGQDLRSFHCNEKGEFIIPNSAKEGILEINIEGTGMPFELQKVDLSLGEHTFIVEQLIPGTMYGKVIDAITGEPVTKFHVKMNASYSGGGTGGYNASWNDPGYSFDSPDGYFDTGGQEIYVGSYYRITVSAKGYNPVMNDLVPVQPIYDNPQRTVFTLEPATIHIGRVISVEGKPIENAEIVFHNINIPLVPEDLPRTTTDSNGIFSIFELGSDFEIMEVRAENYAPDICLMKDITISGGRLKDIVLNYGASLHGYVYDVNDKPVVNAYVFSRYDPQKTDNAETISQLRSNMNQVYTDSHGYYELLNISAGKIEVDVYADEYKQKKFIEIKRGQNLELNFTIKSE